METTPANTMNTRHVLSESKRIMLANYTHFITLALFFLPLSFLLVTNQLFTINQKPRIHHVLFTLLVNVLALCSTATVTYSTHHAFFGEPLTLQASINSLTSSFFPLFWTSFVANALLFLITFTLLMIVGVILILVQSLGLVVFDYNNLGDFMWFPLAVGIVLIVIMFYFQINWSLASVVVVVESKSGFAALKRSAYLVKGMRSVSLLIFLYFGVSCGLMVWICSANVYEKSGKPFVFIVMVGTMFTTMILLCNTAANTVLYNFCKVLHDELPINVAQGTADHKYVSLSYDYENVAQHDVIGSIA